MDFAVLRRKLGNKPLSVLGSAVGQLIAFGFSPVLARFYSPADFGAFVAYSTLFNILNITISGRYEQALYYANSAQKAAATASLAFGLAVTLAFSSTMIVGVLGAFGWLEMSWGLSILAAGSALASVLSRISNLLLVRWNRLKVLAGFNFVKPSSMAILQTVGGALGPSGLTLAIGQSLANFGALSFQVFKEPRLLRFILSFRLPMLRGVMSEHRGFPLYNLPQNLVFVLSDASVPLICTSQFGEMSGGLYWFAARLTSAPMQVLVESVRPVVAEQLVRKVREGQNGARWALLFAAGFAAPFILASAFLFGFGGPLFEFVFGSEWIDAGPVAAVLFLYAATNAAGAPFVAALPLVGAQRAHLIAEVVVLVLKVGALMLCADRTSFFTAVTITLGLTVTGYWAFYLFVWRRLAALPRELVG